MENPGESLGETSEKRQLYISARHINPEKPPGETMESPWSTPNPHQMEISTVFPAEQEPIPMETDGIGESVGEKRASLPI